MEERATFKFFRSFYEAAFHLTDKEQQADFLMAICAYALNGDEPQLEGVAAALFLLVKPNIDASRKKAENGASGASKREANAKQTASKTEANRKQTASKREANVKQPASEEGSRKKEEGSKDVGGNNPPTPFGKDKDRVQWAEHVFMTVSDHEKLMKQYGEADTKRLVEILDNYKGSSGKKYKDDYRAILSWCVDRLEEEKRKEGANRGKHVIAECKKPDADAIAQSNDWMTRYLASCEETEEGN